MRQVFSHFGIIVAFLLGCNTPPEPPLVFAECEPTPIELESCEESIEAAIVDKSNGPSIRMRRVATASRSASVGVHNGTRGVRGTGTYFKFDKHYIIITAAHVVNGTDIIEVRTPMGESAHALLIMFDNRIPNDLAVLVLKEPLQTRTPMKLKLRDDMSNIIGEQLVYTGNPGHHRQMTIFGNVSAHETDGSIILHSYAWGGASGSGVFDNRGKLVGILKATDLNRNPHSPYPQVTEDIVWLAPASSIDIEGIRILLTIHDSMIELYERGSM